MRAKESKTSAISRFHVGGSASLVAGLEEEVRPLIIAKYSSELASAGPVRRRWIEARINWEVRKEVGRKLKKLISPGTLFLGAPSKESKPKGE